MGLFDKGKLEKLTLRVFKPFKAGQKPETSDVAYAVQVNPSSYMLNRRVNYTYDRGLGFTTGEAKHATNDPVSLDFEFLFDGTGVIPKPAPLGDIPLVGAIASALSPSKPFVVQDEIDKFEKVAYDYNSELHEPQALLLVWGNLVFPCKLESVDYRYTLFAEDGTPLRVVAKCTFCESIPGSESVREDDPKSPDLTHLRDVRDGDTLPLLADDVYANAQLYLEVARVNKLVNFRRLRPATRLSFPPLDKQVKAQ